MEHILDVETEAFIRVKEHETTRLEVPAVIEGRELRQYDTIKLYHPGDEREAVRIEISEITETGGQDDVQISFALLEWMYRLDTESEASGIEDFF